MHDIVPHDLAIIGGSSAPVPDFGGAPARAGKRGFLLDAIDGVAMDEIAANASPMPPRHDRGVRSSQIMAVEEAARR